MADKPPKTGRGRPAGRKDTEVIQARVPPGLARALEELAKRTRRTKNAELVIALEERLAAHGLWEKPAVEGGPS